MDSNAGSWSSFRSGIQRAVREVVDGNFRFFEDRSLRSVELSRPAASPPLRTLWTITSADSSDGHSHPSQTDQTTPDSEMQPAPQTPKKHQLVSPGRSPPSSPAEIIASPSTGGSEADRSSPGGLTLSGSTVDSSPAVTPPSPSSSASPSQASVAVAEIDGDVESDGDEDEENLEEAIGGQYVGARGWANEGQPRFVEGGRRGVVVDELVRGMARTRVVSPAGGLV
ncbi:hypothetical protein VTG60DRAFT_7062 [Thermothelomyces hinnuleus]